MAVHAGSLRAPAAFQVMRTHGAGGKESSFLLFPFLPLFRCGNDDHVVSNLLTCITLGVL